MKNRCRKLVCMGMAAFLTVSSMPVTTWAETVTPEEAVAEQPVMEEAVSGTGEVSEDGFEYKELEDGTLEITGYNGSDTTVVIPAEIDGKTVTSIGERAFRYKINLRSVELPDSITGLGKSAFECCIVLNSINLPEGITRIERAVFMDCDRLTGIKLPSGLTSIGQEAFSRCGLTGIELPNSVTSIEKRAFYACMGLTSVKLSSSLTSMGNGVFWDCKSLTDVSVDENNENYSSLDGVLFNKQKTELLYYPTGKTGAYRVPDGVTGIGDSAFEDCTNLTGIEFPDGFTSIGNSSFKGCSSLADVKLPNSLTQMGLYAFENCSSLTSVELPGGLTYIPMNAFRMCSSLTSIEFPSSLTEIESNAFELCSSLTSVELPGGLTYMGSSIFGNCNSLTDISIDESNEKYSSVDGVLFNKAKTKLLSCPAGRTGQFQVPEDVFAIESGAFKGCSSLTDIKLPEDLRTIGYWAFSGCSGLTGIELPDTVTSLGGYAFENCSALTGLELPEKITGIAEDTFLGCNNLTGIRLPDGVTSIGNEAFSGCSNMKYIELPDGVTKIGRHAFVDCGSLTSIELPNNLTSIGAYAFSGCNNLVILCEENSYAHTYAATNNMAFQLIVKYTINFDANGGDTLDQTSLVIREGNTLGELQTPVRTGYTFKGWFTEKTGGTAVTKDTVPTADMTVYAQWEQIPDENESGKPGTEPGEEPGDTPDKTPDQPQQKQSLEKAVITVATTNYAYDGKKKTPAVSVTLDGKTLAANTDYTVTYQKNQNIGTATVTITGAGNYTGTVTGTFTISAKKGTSFTVGAYKYKISNSREVAFAGLKSAKTTKVVIPKTVKIGGKTFKVTSVAKKALYQKTKVTSVTIGANVVTIEASAFAGCKKLSTITINTTKLKSAGKNAFKGIKATAKIKVPSKKLKDYKKILKNRGQGRKVKIVKK